MDEIQLFSHLVTGGGGVVTAVAAIYALDFLKRRNAGDPNAMIVSALRAEIAALKNSEESAVTAAITVIERDLKELKRDVRAIRDEGHERERRNAEDHAAMQTGMATVTAEVAGLKTALGRPVQAV